VNSHLSQTSGYIGEPTTHILRQARTAFALNNRNYGFGEKTMRSQIGQPAIPFDLLDTQGRPHRLADYAGKWLLLVFHRHLG
jgi:hypothetical protein